MADRWTRFMDMLDEYLASASVLVISSDEIEPEERIGSLPASGYVWVE